MNLPKISLAKQQLVRCGILEISVSGVAADSLVDIAVVWNGKSNVLSDTANASGIAEFRFFVSGEGSGKVEFAGCSGYSAEPAQFWLVDAAFDASDVIHSLAVSKTRGYPGAEVFTWTDAAKLLLSRGDRSPVYLDVSVAGVAAFTLDAPGMFWISVLPDKKAAPAPIRIECLAQQEVNSGVVPTAACSGEVIITPSFGKSSVTPGNSVTLKLAIANRTPHAQTVSMPALQLPAGITSPTPIELTNEVVQPFAIRSLFFQVTITGSESSQKSIVIPSDSATYICDGLQYYALGGAANIQLQAPDAVCGLVADYIMFTPSTVASGALTKLKLRLRNSGESAASAVNLIATPLPAAFSPSFISFDGISIPAGGTYTFEKDLLVTNTGAVAKDLEVSIGAFRISGECSGKTVYVSEGISGIVTVNAPV